MPKDIGFQIVMAKFTLLRNFALFHSHLWSVSQNDHIMRQSELNSKKSIVSPSTVAKTHLTNQSFIFEKLVSKRDNQACFAESDPTLPAPFPLKKEIEKAAGKLRLEMGWVRGIMNSACPSISDHPTLSETSPANGAY